MLWQKKGVAHELFLTEKGGPGHLKILVQKGGSSYLFIVEKNLTCNDYCYHRELAIIVVLPVRGRVLFVCRVKSKSNSSLSQMFESLAV